MALDVIQVVRLTAWRLLRHTTSIELLVGSHQTLGDTAVSIRCPIDEIAKPLT